MQGRSGVPPQGANRVRSFDVLITDPPPIAPAHPPEALGGAFWSLAPSVMLLGLPQSWGAAHPSSATRPACSGRGQDKEMPGRGSQGLPGRAWQTPAGWGQAGRGLGGKE